MKIAPAGNRQSGFALFEAVGALLIASLAFVMVATATGLVARSNERAKALANAHERLIAGTHAWQRDMLSTIDLGALGFDGHAEDFVGTPTSIRFAAAPRGLAGIVETVSINADGERLVRRSRPLGRLGERFPQESVVLMEGPWRYRFAYAGIAPGGGLDWQASWIDLERAPVAVRLSVSTEEGEVAIVTARLWPTSTNGACPFDPSGCEKREGGDAAR